MNSSGATDATGSAPLPQPVLFAYAEVSPTPSTVLLVEDDHQLRRLLRSILEEEGYVVIEAASAEAGLDHLSRGRVDAVLADYRLPKASGAWMLAEAGRHGLLCGVPSFIVTGEGGTNQDDYAVIPKPIDFEGLLATLREAVREAAEERRRAGRRVSRPAARSTSNDSSGARSQDPIELVLYISSSSIHSAAALRNIRQVLEHFDGPPVKLRVHDLSKEPHVRDTHNVVFTPALLSNGFGRRTWIVGNLQNPRVLLELLDDASERS